MDFQPILAGHGGGAHLIDIAANPLPGVQRCSTSAVDEYGIGHFKRKERSRGRGPVGIGVLRGVQVKVVTSSVGSQIELRRHFVLIGVAGRGDFRNQRGATAGVKAVSVIDRCAVFLPGGGVGGGERIVG